MSIVPGRIVEISGAWPGRTPKLPSVPGTTTISTMSDRIRRSGETSSNRIWSAIGAGSGRLGGHLAGLLDGFLDRADHVEGALGHVVVIAGDDALEALDRIGELDEDARRASEHLGDMEGLRQEALDLARARDGQLVLFGQFVHAEDRDD